MASSTSTTYSSPCAACKFLRRKCMPSCIFAPYFPAEDSQKFANVHKIFGASNVSKLLNDILPNQREDAVSSLAFEAEARVRDPVYGCVGSITFLQRQVQRLQKELDAVNAHRIRYATSNEILAPQGASVVSQPMASHLRQMEINRRSIISNQGIIGTHQQRPDDHFPLPNSLPWDHFPSEKYQ